MRLINASDSILSRFDSVEAIEAECRRLAPLMGIVIDGFSDPDKLFLKDQCLWIGVVTSPPREGFGSIDGKYRLLTHYWPDFIYYHLGLAFADGQALRPRLESDPDASCLWWALLASPLDQAGLGALRDRLLELGVRDV